MNINIDLVIVHYDNDSFLKLVNDETYNIFNHVYIFNKNCNNHITKDRILAENVSIINIPNEGRENTTYIQYMIDIYEKLNTFTVFIQDDVENHLILDMFISLVKTHSCQETKKYIQIPTKYRKHEKNYGINRTIRNGCHHLHTLSRPDFAKYMCNEFNLRLPSMYTTLLCSFHMIHRDKIREYDIDFWKRLQQFIQIPVVCQANGHFKGNEGLWREYDMEHFWYVIFNQ